MLIASNVFALILAAVMSDRKDNETFQVLAETGYTEEGLPSQMVTRVLSIFGQLAFSRETSRGRTLICQYNLITGLRKVAIEGGTEILVAKDRPYVKKSISDQRWPVPDRTHMRRMAGFDCYGARSEDVETWSRKSNPEEIVGIIIYFHRKVSESVVFLENRKSSESDVRFFALPAKAHMKWVTAKELDAFIEKYVPTTTPDWVWTRQ